MSWQTFKAGTCVFRNLMSPKSGSGNSIFARLFSKYFPTQKIFTDFRQEIGGCKTSLFKTGWAHVFHIGIILTLSLISYTTFDNAGTMSVLD